MPKSFNTFIKASLSKIHSLIGVLPDALNYRQLWLYTVVVAIIAIIQVYQHLEASYALPTPWPDESHFLWQAVAFQDHFSIFSEELNPYRTIFWMPPGFMIITSIAFKLFGVSLAVARTVSLSFMLGSLVLTALILYKLPYRILSIVSMAAFFLNASIVAAGNVARPEAPMLFCVLAALLMLQREKYCLSLSLFFLSPLVHPSGLFFLLGGSVYIFLSGHFRELLLKPKRIELFVSGLVIICWLVYIVSALLNWSDFKHDMMYQINRKTCRDIAGVLLTTENAILMLTVLLTQLYAVHHKLRIALLLSFAVPAWFIYKLGNEMWYTSIFSLSLLFVSLLWLHVSSHLITSMKLSLARLVRPVLMTLAILIVLFFNYQNSTVMKPSDYFTDMEWHGMTFMDSTPYISDKDIDQLTILIDSLKVEEEDPTIQFMPRADAFLIYEKLGDRYRVSNPLFCDRVADYYIFHNSRYYPSWWQMFIDRDLKAIGYDSLDDSVLFFTRDSTESWYCLTPQSQKKTNP